MNKFEHTLYDLMIYDKKNRVGESKLSSIKVKEEVCKKILKYLTEEDIAVICTERKDPGEESYAEGIFILEKYNIKIKVSVCTEFISAYATYFGKEEVKEKLRKLVSFKGEFSKKIILDGQYFEIFEEILLVKTIEFLRDLKLVDNEEIQF